MTSDQHADIKRSAKNLAAVMFAIFTTLFLVSLAWRTDTVWAAETSLAWFVVSVAISMSTGWVYYQCKLNYIAVRQVLLSTTSHLNTNNFGWPES